jgi:hypothetical protein
VYMDYGDGSKDFLFGGILTIQEGIVWVILHLIPQKIISVLILLNIK